VQRAVRARALLLHPEEFPLPPARPAGPWNTTWVSGEKRRTTARFFQIILLARSPALPPNELSARLPSRWKLSLKISLVGAARGVISGTGPASDRQVSCDNPEPEILE